VKFNVIASGSASTKLRSAELCPPLTERLQQLGYTFVDDFKDANLLICFNHNPGTYRKFVSAGGKKNRAVLVRLEPHAVFPSQYTEKIASLYGLILTLGEIASDSEGCLPWPYYFNDNPLHPEGHLINLSFKVQELIEAELFTFKNWQARKIPISLIASDKVSAVRGNNYKIRRQLASQLPASELSVYGNYWRASFPQKVAHRLAVLKFSIQSRTIPNLFEIYGNLLQSYDSARGTVKNKHVVVQDSKFSLVIENDDNYISEKVIDALIGGSIPIFIGGDFRRVGIPEASVVSNLRAPEEILNFIRNYKEEDITQRLAITKNWISSPAFLERWHGDSVYYSCGNIIDSYFGNLVA
jgi:hypothetical protein